MPEQVELIVTPANVRTYTNLLRRTVGEESQEHLDFQTLLKDYQTRRIGTSTFIACIKELFKEHRELVLGFKVFLPSGYEMVIDDNDMPENIESETIAFANKVKQRFRDNISVYASFTELMNKYMEGTISRLGKEVSVLFQNHPDLMEEFITLFLPDEPEEPDAPPYTPCYDVPSTSSD